jgi:dihydroxyacetone kinase DhaKLM complex PTS-EIIA-like component DhaM
MKRYETEREKILKGRRFVQDHHEDMALGSEDMAKTMRQYEVRLDECNQLIAQANADVLEELGQVAQKEIDLKAEERRLCVHHQKAIEEVTRCQTIGTLMRLGSSGMTTLLLQLEERNVNLVGLAEAIMAESAVAAREQHSPTNDFP